MRKIQAPLILTRQHICGCSHFCSRLCTSEIRITSLKSEPSSKRAAPLLQSIQSTHLWLFPLLLMTRYVCSPHRVGMQLRSTPPSKSAAPLLQSNNHLRTTEHLRHKVASIRAVGEHQLCFPRSMAADRVPYRRHAARTYRLRGQQQPPLLRIQRR
jgi:hypothetical protein